MKKFIFALSIFLISVLCLAEEIPKLQPELEDDLANFSIPETTLMRVEVFFEELELSNDEVLSSVLSTDFVDGQEIIMLNDKEISKEELDNFIKEEREIILSKAIERESLRKEFLNNLAETTGISELKNLLPQESIVTVLSKADVLKLVDIDEIVRIEYYQEPEDSITSAMLNTNIDPWALDYGRTGDGIGVYMSESGCTEEITGYIQSPIPPYVQLPIYLFNYDNITNTTNNTQHSKNVQGILRAVSPSSYIYCRDGFVYPTDTDLLGYNNNPIIHVENHSWGVTSSSLSSAYSNKDKIFDNHVYNTLVPVFVAAGNKADDDWDDDQIINSHYVDSPGKALNVITVGAYNHNTMKQANFSSFRNSAIGNNKPEISAPGVSITASGVNMSGTSQATPHAAAMAADLLGSYAWMMNRPQLVKAAMIASTNNNITPYYSGFTTKDQVGEGAIDYRSIYYEGHTKTWTGSNSDYASYTTTNSNNGYIEYSFSVSVPTNAHLKIAVAWLNRGNYVSTNGAMGMDFNIWLYDPNGTQVASSLNTGNPYRFIRYDPTVSGTYKVRIKRVSNADSQSNIHLSMWINKDS